MKFLELLFTPLISCCSIMDDTNEDGCQQEKS